MKRERITLVVLAALALGCADDGGGEAEASTGAPDASSTSSDTSSSGSPPDTTASVDTSTSDESSSGSDGPSEGCPLDGGIVLQLGAADFTPETIDIGGGSSAWSLLASPSASLGTVGPGDDVVVSVVLDGPLSASRDGREFTIEIAAEADGIIRGSGTPETITTSIGAFAPGPWLPSLSTTASGELIRLTLGGITINPNAGEDLSCFSVRAQIPAQANSVEDSSLIDIVAGPELSVSSVRLSMSGDGDAEPFGLVFE